MFNKKGLSYIDWIISMGLFLLVVIMIFTFLRPGATPAFQSSELFEIVEDNFFQNVSWHTASLPVAVKNMEFNNVTITLKHNYTSDWKFIEVQIPSQFSSKINFTQTGIETSLNCRSSSPPCKTGSDPALPRPGIYVTSIKNPTAEIEKNYEITGECNHAYPECEYTLGSTEYFTGINLQNTLNFQSSKYDKIKNSWNFPVTREFTLSLFYLNGTKIELISPSFPVPPEANIFVKEISTSILNHDGSREPITINIQVW